MNCIANLCVMCFRWEEEESRGFLFIESCRCSTKYSDRISMYDDTFCLISSLSRLISDFWDHYFFVVREYRSKSWEEVSFWLIYEDNDFPIESYVHLIFFFVVFSAFVKECSLWDILELHEAILWKEFCYLERNIGLPGWRRSIEKDIELRILSKCREHGEKYY